METEESNIYPDIIGILLEMFELRYLFNPGFIKRCQYGLKFMTFTFFRSSLCNSGSCMKFAFFKSSKIPKSNRG